MIIKKEISLEIQSQDTKETLNWKLEQLESKNLPVESGLADYIYFGVSNIDKKIEQLKNYKDAIIEEINSLAKYKASVVEDCAEWIQSQGIEKLNGLECSSITINKGSDKEEKIKVIETNYYYQGFLFTKDSLIAELLKSNVIFENLITEKITVPATKDKIRINKKR